MAWSVQGTTFLGVFDINCWYQDQMPSSCEPGVLCPYFSISALPLDASELLDLAVHTSTIAKFGTTGSQVEQHFQPSSLRFSLTALLPTGWLEASHLGLQRKVLAELGKPGSLVNPTHLYQFCIHAGLCFGPFDPSLLSQRRALLSVLLEHSMVGSIVAAAREWSDGSLVKAGCTLRSVFQSINLVFSHTKSPGSCWTGPGAGWLASRSRLTDRLCLSLTSACSKLRVVAGGRWPVLQV